ncbi:MAG: ABC transporter permease [Tissierellia bacterium]|nr:ABC transporter permease [Tissierellia bacterium]
MVSKVSKRIYLALAFIFLYAPIIVLIVFSFNDSRLRGNWAGFSFRWYIELFNDRNILMAFYNTIVVAVVSTVISTIIGTFAAIGIHSLRGAKKSVMLNLNYLPVLNPDIVTAVSLMALFRFLSVKFGLGTLIISHIVFSIPYVVLSILPKLRQLDPNLLDAAMDLGATPFIAIRKVIIPQIIPGIVTGALIAFTMSIDDFAISFFNTGQGVSNLSITIYSMTKRGINPSINALSTIMFVVLIGLLLIINKRSKLIDE